MMSRSCGFWFDSELKILFHMSWDTITIFKDSSTDYLEERAMSLYMIRHVTSSSASQTSFHRLE